jgi:glycosyltransferase involved in cell wall biosynthesis
MFRHGKVSAGQFEYGDCFKEQNYTIEDIVLLQNPALQESMGQAGRKRVEDHFSLSLMLQKYLHLLPG